jgi:hypothetical protein
MKTTLGICKGNFFTRDDLVEELPEKIGSSDAVLSGEPSDFKFDRERR